MAPADICELNLTDLSRLIAARELSSSEATSAALTRLEQLEDRLNAFITVLREQALAEAKKADEEIAARKLSRRSSRDSRYDQGHV